MTLYDKITAIYPDLNFSDFSVEKIYLRNDLDDKGDYIANWKDATHPQPTQEQLDAVGSAS